ncbi:polymorphic toxin type 50 domain-containing protein [Agromyces silvae]|uniref:polymorphic toxin type 50 domain-containing protein n=1 Tax=Agromyces silvae TaxID=3388266 RepID=UPI00280C2A08|nr:polymorphic toxin type 50 domain-containing protein [Agromyces protaetiae]
MADRAKHKQAPATIDLPVAGASVVAVPLAAAGGASWLTEITWGAVGRLLGFGGALGGVLMMCGSSTESCANSNEQALGEQSTPAPPDMDGCPPIVLDCSDWEESADRTLDASEMVNGDPFAPAVNWGQQEKHFPDHFNVDPRKSVLTADPRLLARHAGTGTPVGKLPVGHPGSRERVDFGEPIGRFVDRNTGAITETTRGITHYGKKGIHVVPSRPIE